MKHRRSLALPAALCLAIAGACQDAPLGPRAPDRITVAAAVPNDVISGGGSATVPQILSHSERFYFGSHNQTSSTPSGVQGDMTFIGDMGEIKLSSLVVTPDSGGAPFVANTGDIAYGAGQIINCADVTSGCNQRHLNGVRTFGAAPDCNAHASGTVGYSASISQTTFSGLGTPSTTNGQSVSASVPISATAPGCSSTTGSQPTDTTTTPSTGTVGPPPPPTGPNVPTAPPPPQSGAGGGFACDRTDFYQIIGTTRTLLNTTIDCYPD